MARVSRKQQDATPPNGSASESEKLYKAALYARLSVEDNGKDSDSIESQLAFLNEYVARHSELRRAAVFTDNGYTGTNFDRPEWNKLLDEVRCGAINCIIVKDLSRLGRNYVETGDFLEKVCPLLGIRFISVNDGFDTLYSNSNTQLAASLSNIINDYYARDISRKVTTALQIKMSNGEYIGNYAPHGYSKDPADKNHLIIDEETAPIIRRIFSMRATGMSYGAINSTLNAEGIPSPSEWKRLHGIKTNNNQKTRTILWNRHMLSEILGNIVYIGNLAQKKGSQCLYGGVPYHITNPDEWVVVCGTHEPIIDLSLFQKVQEINDAVRNETKSNYGKYDHLPKEKNIYGKKMLCADCGARMKLHRSFSTKKDRVYFTYNCPTYSEHKSQGCSTHIMRKADVDEAVLQTIKTQMNVFLDLEQTLKALLAQKQAMLNTKVSRKQRAGVEAQGKRLRSVLSELYVDYKDGLLTGDEYLMQKRKYADKLDRLAQELDSINRDKEDTAEKLIGTKRWEALVHEYYNAQTISKELVDAFISEIKVHGDGSLDIELNYMDEFQALIETTERIRGEVA